VESIAAEKTELVVLHFEENVNSGLNLVLAQSLVPSKKMEFILQKTTELGISEFVPLETARSLKTRKTEYDRKTQRWAKITRQAVKQSKGSVLPEVRNPVSLAAFLERGNEGKRIFLSERTGSLLKNLIMEPLETGAKPPESAVVVIGPEGGWTEEEEEAFQKYGYEASSLGSRILRTETAALTAAAIMIHFWSH
jgi:16S rRNA (uracil1498-N3)-methyltransferase